MNRIDQLFSEKKRGILSVYFTAGYPRLNDTLPLLETLQQEGVDLVEIGIPFSDPLADGPVIQESSRIALRNGMSLQLLFGQLREARKSISIPLVLMGYLNPVLQFGVERFCKACSDCGIDGVILPDLPPDEYEKDYRAIFQQYGLHVIFLITPQTSEARIRRIDALSGGFVYLVSAAAVTGAQRSFGGTQEEYFKRIAAMSLRNPALIGFGIHDRATFSSACSCARGAIVGSAFIRALNENFSPQENVRRFVSSIKNQSHDHPVA